MKKHIIISFTSLSFLGANAQNYESIQIKEQYDKLENFQLNSSDSPILPLGTCSQRPSTFSVRIEHSAFYLLSLLSMYETTRDKAYLVKFVNYTINLQSLRNDLCDIPGFESHPGWVYEADEADANGSDVLLDELMYIDGHVIMPMAKFVYMVNSDPDLTSTLLPQIGLIGSSTFGSFSTYIQFAQWLKNRVKETLQWYLYDAYGKGYWEDDHAFKQWVDDDFGNAMNLQIGFAVALAYIGKAEPIQDYLDKAEIIAGLFKSRVKLREDNACDIGNPVTLEK